MVVLLKYHKDLFVVRSEHASQCNHEPIWVWPSLLISRSSLMCATWRYGEKGEPFEDPLARAEGEPSF